MSAPLWSPPEGVRRTTEAVQQQGGGRESQAAPTGGSNSGERPGTSRGAVGSQLPCTQALAGSPEQRHRLPPESPCALDHSPRHSPATRDKGKAKLKHAGAPELAPLREPAQLDAPRPRQQQHQQHQQPQQHQQHQDQGQHDHHCRRQHEREAERVEVQQHSLTENGERNFLERIDGVLHVRNPRARHGPPARAVTLLRALRNRRAPGDLVLGAQLAELLGRGPSATAWQLPWSSAWCRILAEAAGVQVNGAGEGSWTRLGRAAALAVVEGAVAVHLSVSCKGENGKQARQVSPYARDAMDALLMALVVRCASPDAEQCAAQPLALLRMPLINADIFRARRCWAHPRPPARVQDKDASGQEVTLALRALKVLPVEPGSGAVPTLLRAIPVAVGACARLAHRGAGVPAGDAALPGIEDRHLAAALDLLEKCERLLDTGVLACMYKAPDGLPAPLERIFKKAQTQRRHAAALLERAEDLRAGSADARRWASEASAEVRDKFFPLELRDRSESEVLLWHSVEYGSATVTGHMLSEEWRREYLAVRPDEHEFVPAMARGAVGLGLEEGCVASQQRLAGPSPRKKPRPRNRAARGLTRDDPIVLD